MKAFLSLAIFILLLVTPGCKPTPSEKKPTLTATEDLVLQELQQAISDHPDSVKLYERLIDTLTSRGNFADAAAWCTQLINRGADSNYYYWYVKGDIFRQGKIYDSAIAAYQFYLQKFPDDELILLNLGSAYAEAGNATAIDLADNLVRRFTTQEMRSKSAFIKGVYFNTIKNYGEARKWLDTTLLLNYNFDEAYMEKGYGYYDEAKYKEALGSFTTLTNLNGDYADGWYWMAKSQEALGQKKEAIVNYEQAYALDNNIAEAKQAVERLKKELGIRN
jgi:tetratricopeptide (TPR) repeat protein